MGAHGSPGARVGKKESQETSAKPVRASRAGAELSGLLPPGMYQRGPSFYGRFRDPRTGSEVRRSLGRNRDEAVRSFLRFQAEGSQPGAPPIGPSLGDVLAYYLAHVHRQHRDKLRTLENAEQAVKIIRRLDPEAPVGKLGQADFWRFRDTRSAEVSSTASANLTLRYLKAALNRGVRDGLIERLPFRVEMLPEPPKRNRALPQGQVAKVLRIALQEDPRAHAILFIAYTLGLRLSEVLNLWWRDVDLEEGSLQVEAKPAIPTLGVKAWSPKTRQRRVLVLDEDARKFLAEWRSRVSHNGPTGYVVPRDLRRGTPFTRRWAGELLAKIFAAAKVKGGTHSLRHTMVTEALEAGVPIHVVQRMAGHSSVATTLGHYAHVRDAALREAALLLANRRRGAVE